ncbi:uncharacterized protein N7483_012410 [Penicillium malachiteum]|uniref:uncharacterized protein n=1 Tax=Penicillium malachiteum TaxID=1324776 RepID=UPI002548E54B|nr:uncharacterized protein N7483_012410 [Penicillium malachiteum]KAJ5715229.1 hypothetical protein N7483_012410 [Penicillium malachiteum]
MTSTRPIALTTTFTPPPACTTNTWFIEYVSGTNYYTEIITGSDTSWWLSLGPTETGTCYPSGYQASTETYFSPGICPEGYWTAAQTVVTDDGDSETRGTCCPNNYVAQTETNLAWYTHNACTSYNPNPSQKWTFTKAETISSTTRADGINAQGISIRWKATDFPDKTTTSDISTVSTTSVVFTAPTATNEVTQTTGSGKGLSTGAKAGIVVGAATCVLSLIAVAILLCIRRRQNQRTGRQNEKVQGNGGISYEMSTNAQKPAELGSRYVSLAELQSDQKHRAELETPGMYGIAELDTGQYPRRSPILDFK